MLYRCASCQDDVNLASAWHDPCISLSSLFTSRRDSIYFNPASRPSKFVDGCGIIGGVLTGLLSARLPPVRPSLGTMRINTRPAASLWPGAFAFVLIFASCPDATRGIHLHGVKCAPHAILQDGPCPEPGSCLVNSTIPACVTWEVTSFTLSPEADAEQHRMRFRCTGFDGEGGHFVNDTWTISNSSACNLAHAWLSPDQMHFRLKHHHIVISGDSMQRQVSQGALTRAAACTCSAIQAYFNLWQSCPHWMLSMNVSW